MKPISAASVFLEDIHELARRWARHTPRPPVTADELAATAIRRATEALEAGRVPRQKLLEATTRAWELGWRRDARWGALEAWLAARSVGCRLVPSANFCATDLNDPTAGDNLVLIPLDLAAGLAADLVAAGLEVPFSERDGAVLLLAREVYHRLAEQMETLPHPVLERAATGVFIQHVLGLPFCPWLLDVVAAARG
jgi:hypothetical protein